MPVPKRSLDIESALRWAFRDELPKRVPVALDRAGVARRTAPAPSGVEAGETVTQRMMDRASNRFGVVPDLARPGEAHPDAVLIGRAVEDLDTHEIGVPPGWDPLPEWAGLPADVLAHVRATVERLAGEVEGATRLFGMKASSLVRRHALAGGAPGWEARVPAVKVQSTPNGQPLWFVRRVEWVKTVDGRDVPHEVEENGYDPRGKRPFRDAYRKTFLDPDPTAAILGRAEYEVWHAALDALCADLAPRLATIRLTPTRRAARPWVEAEAAPSVLPDLSDLGPLVRLAPARGRAGMRRGAGGATASG